MNTRFFQKILALVVAGSVALLAENALAQNSSIAPLSYGANEVVKLAQAKISDDTIMAYIKNNHVDYNMNADQILYVRQQGVSDAVITLMLNQPKSPNAPTMVSATATPAPQAAASTVVVQPAVTYVQPAPVTYIQPAYYPAYGYCAPTFPSVSLAFGFGGYYGGGHYYGGGNRCYYGGAHYGGWHN
jgi:hypothetical protein